MKKLCRLWLALEAPHELTGVRKHLQRWLGDEMRIAEPFLRALPELSETYPCPSPGGEGCPRKVVRREDGSFWAVCGCRPAECDDVPVTRSDLVQHRLDPSAFCAGIAETLAFTPGANRLALQPRIWCAGSLAPNGHGRRPVFLALPDSRQKLRDATDHLLAHFDEPFVLLVPSPRSYDPGIDEDLKKRESRLVALSDILAAGETGMVALTTLAGLAGASTRKPKPAPQEGLVRIETAPGTIWPEVHIRFQNGETVSIEVRGEYRVLSCEQMGMSSDKNRQPTKQWELLRRLAPNEGRLGWTLPGADRGLTKQIELLGKDMRKVFPSIPGRPISKYRRGVGWHTNFALKPEK